MLSCSLVFPWACCIKSHGTNQSTDSTKTTAWNASLGTISMRQSSICTQYTSNAQGPGRCSCNCCNSYSSIFFTVCSQCLIVDAEGGLREKRHGNRLEHRQEHRLEHRSSQIAFGGLPQSAE